MFTLYSSMNCGMSYEPDTTAKTIEELKPRMDELDGMMLRWYIEEDGKIREPLSKIHQGILSFLEELTKNER